MSDKCTCSFCRTHDLYRWASINECGCGCHKESDIVGHDSLCCPYVNGKKINNPYTDLDTAKHYLAVIQLLEQVADDEMKVYDRKRMEELRVKFESEII